MYYLRTEDVSSYRCRMYHLPIVRCIIFLGYLTYGSEGRRSGHCRMAIHSLPLRYVRLRLAESFHQDAHLLGREDLAMRAVARLMEFLQHLSVAPHPQAEIRYGGINVRCLRKIKPRQLSFGVRTDSECCFVHIRKFLVLLMFILTHFIRMTKRI